MEQELIEKIKGLSRDSVAEVKGSVDSTSLHRALANYAIQCAGTDADVDPALEAAATNHLLQQDSKQRNLVTGLNDIDDLS